MTAEKLTRTSYTDPGSGLPRSGSTARSESRVDLEQYAQPSQRIHGAALHEQGVAAGLEVAVVLGTAGVRVQPGVALDVHGRQLSLAPGGLALSDATTVLDVGPDGVLLPTTGAGRRVLTISFAETFDARTFSESQFTVFQLDQTPLLELRIAEGFVDDGNAVQLALLTLDEDGTVTEVSTGRRRGVGTPVHRVTFRRSTETAGPDGVRVEHVEAGELRGRPAGGLQLRVPAATDEVDIASEGGSFAVFSVAAERVEVRGGASLRTLLFDATAGNLGIGEATTPRTALHLPERGLQIGASTTASENFHLRSDVTDGSRGLRLYEGDHGSGTPLLTAVSGSGQVGIGTTTPLGRLHVRAEGGFGTEDEEGRPRRSDVPLLAQSDGTAFGILNGDGRAAFALNINGNGGTAVDRGAPTFYDRNDGTWHRALTLRNGFVGMGTAAPSAQLEVVHKGSAFAAKVRTTSAVAAVRAENTSTGPAISADARSGNGVSSKSDTAVAVCGISRTSIGVSGSSTGGTGVFGSSRDGLAGSFSGDVRVTGTLTKAGGQFRIDHPLDPAGRYLSHSFVESSEMKNVYDGVAELDADGAAEVQLADWCEALNESFRYQLTPVGAAAPELHVAAEIGGNRFRIAGGAPGMRVCWQVTGVRRDAYALAHPLTVDEEKPPAERGYYLHPDLFDQPVERDIEWARQPRAARLLTLQRRRMAIRARIDQNATEE